MALVIYSQFLSVTLTSFSIEKVMYFSVFSTKQLNCPLNSFASFFFIKWWS